MQNSSDLTMIAVIAVAFVLGYLIVSFVFYLLKRGRENKADDSQKRENRQYSGTYENENPGWDSGNNTSKRSGAADRSIADEAYFIGVLGLPRIFTKEELESNHRRLAAQYHPDKVNHLGPKLKETAEREMKKINEAYAFLKSSHNL
jgi:hypothetical protein